MQSFVSRVRQFIGRLSLGQKAGLALVAVGTVALLFGTAYWSSQPEYALLFGNLKAGDAGNVVETLRQEGTPYELRDGERAIYVPREQVHDLRLRFASEGMVSGEQVGYELFDEGTLGMTDFMQKLNKKRALEGELARTISSVGQVERARVHLVMPERNPFRGEQVQASASVILGLRSGAMNQARIRAITELVAGSVESLSPAQVTVLDSDGNMLSNPDAGDEDLMLTSTQLDMQRSVEKHLAESGQTMLERVMGTDNALVRVAADLDFDRIVTESNTVDPESQTVISEERMTEGTEGGNGENQNANSAVRNYEVSRSRERSEKSVGDVARLTVSVVLDHQREPPAEGGGAPTYVPRTAEELAEAEELVKNAVGFNPDRGDRFTIQQARFDTQQQDQVTQAMREQRRDERLQLYLRYGLIALALGVAVWLVRSMARRLTSEGAVVPFQLQPATAGAGAGDTPELSTSRPTEEERADEEEMVLVDDIYTSKLSNEAKARLEAKSEMFNEIKGQAEENPEEAAELIRSWLVSEPAAA